MMYIQLAIAALALSSCANAITPVQKVLDMMSEMESKGKLMMEEETKTYKTYKEWVDDTSTQLGFEIKTAKSDIEELLAFIAKADSDVSTLSDSIKELDTEIATLETEQKDATALRTSQHEEYVKISTDYGESVDALRGAIQTMKSKDYDVPQAEAMLQKMATAIPGMRRVFAEFLQSTDNAEQQKGGPAVAAYEFQSGGIIELLEKFLKKFQGELADVESAESNQAHAYDQEMLHLTDTLAYANKELEDKSAQKAKRSAESAAAKGKLADTKSDLAADEKTLADTKATFAAKTSQYEENQKVRTDELEAIAKAIEIIADPSVAGSYGKHINLAQTTFLQIRSATSRVNLATVRQLFSTSVRRC